MTNYHSHCNYCDGKGTIEEFVVAAVRGGFSTYGVSTHSPLPFDAPWVISLDRVGDYLREIEELKIKYAGQIELLAGMEIDYLDEQYNPANTYFQGLMLDYRIGSVHFVRSERDGSPIDVDCSIADFSRNVDHHFAGSLERVIRGYYKAKTAMIETAGFDFVGHADKISMNASVLSGHIVDKPWYQTLVADFLDLCAARDVRLEINTKAWEVKGVFFPDERYFRRIAQLDIAVVVNSDSHRTDRIALGLNEAHLRLRKAGIERIETFSNGIWSVKN